MTPDAEALIERIETLRAKPRFGWADSTLRDIAQTVERWGIATQKQKDAIANIENARRSSEDGEALPSDRLRGSRRYEGYSRPGGSKWHDAE